MATAADTCPSLDVPRKIHIVGVGGPGMSAIAVALVEMGHYVSGSDVVESPILDRLRAMGVTVHSGHNPSNVEASTDAVVVSTAISLTNSEVASAQERGIPVLRRDVLLPAMTAIRSTIAVAGTHGKTTTASMLALILRQAGKDPSFLIGGVLTQLGTNAHWGRDNLFVLEADESDGSGFAVTATALIVTNIEPDHLEFHGSTENLHNSFASFMQTVDGPVVVCADDPVAREIGETVAARTYGFAFNADVRIENFVGDRSGSRFSIVVDGGTQGDVFVPVAGAHNAVNACGAIALALEFGVTVETAADALASFGGVGRRFEHRGEEGGVVVIDDYAHLPTEVAAAISAGRSGGWGRVVTVFQPHRYSRTQSLAHEFADAFVGADLLVLTEIYPAGEAPRDGVSGQLVVDAVQTAHPEQEIIYAHDRSMLARVVVDQLRGGDLCLTLGAGDITRLADEILSLLADRNRH